MSKSPSSHCLSFILRPIIRSSFMILPMMMALFLSGCSLETNKLIRHEQAKRIYAPANLARNDIATDYFPLATFERVNHFNHDAIIYIDGEAKGPADYTITPHDPTPIHFTGLKLAAADRGKNVIYAGAPCAFMPAQTYQNCDARYFTTARYSDDVISGYSQMLDWYQKRYNIKGFHLVGYSGGATIATLLAKSRPDVLSLRSVAGVMDTDLTSELAHAPAFALSKNPTQNSEYNAIALGVIPQHHFIGGKDKQVPPAVLSSYIQSIGPSRCVRTTLIPDADHRDGWDKIWSQLLREPVDCSARDIRYARDIRNESDDL